MHTYTCIVDRPFFKYPYFCVSTLFLLQTPPASTGTRTWKPKAKCLSKGQQNRHERGRIKESFHLALSWPLDLSLQCFSWRPQANRSKKEKERERLGEMCVTERGGGGGERHSIELAVIFRQPPTPWALRCYTPVLQLFLSMTVVLCMCLLCYHNILLLLYLTIVTDKHPSLYPHHVGSNARVKFKPVYII